MAMGYSFQPGADQAMGPNGQGGRSVPAPASSVKTLSFRMPKHNIPGATAPAALLNAQGSGGMTTGGAQTSGLTPQLLSLLLQAFSAGPQQGPAVPKMFDGPSSGMFEGSAGGGNAGSSDPAGVHGPSPSFGPPTPKFTIGDGGRLPLDLGSGFVSGPRPSYNEVDLGSGFVPVGGFLERGQPDRNAPDRWGVSPMPRYKYGDDLPTMIDDSLSMPFGQPMDRGYGRMLF